MARSKRTKIIDGSGNDEQKLGNFLNEGTAEYENTDTEESFSFLPFKKNFEENKLKIFTANVFR